MKKKPTAKAKASRTKTKVPKPNSKPSQSKSSARPKSLMLVYGFGEEQQPRAAVFQEADYKLARKAAGMLRLEVFVGKAEKIQPAVKGLKAGRVYAAGKGFAPDVDPQRFEELLAALQLPTPPSPKPAPKLPVSWDAVEVGHVVMAQADSPADGWWPAVVEAKDGGVLALRSTDFPDITVARHRYTVALVYTPDYVPPNDLAEAAPGLPKTWERLEAGHLVIACERRAEGSFEAIVTRVEAGQVTMRWRDFSKLPAFTRPFAEIALLYPKAPELKASESDGRPA